MKTNLFFRIFTALLISKAAFSQQLVINEVSQGPSGSKEYVELVVVGTPTCNAIPCMDLTNYIIDDNNGNHAIGAGTGIASGCVKLRNIPFWSCIPIGTMILIYNDADLNAAVPPQDLSMTDGNCRLVIPISDCTLLERHTSIPSTGTSVYPSTGFSTCGSWTPISMANTDDSFQTINAAGGLVHSVSWGNNNLAPIIYFAGGAAGKVAVMNNTIDNNPANQANWAMVTTLGNETPGSPNNTANSNWIHSMNNSCLPLLPFSGTVTSSNAGCTCNGSATIMASGAIGPYTYTWFPSGGNSASASGLCGGVYTVSSTSSNGCTQTKTVNIASVGSLSLTINSTSITCNGLSNGSATVIPSGGSPAYSYTWSPSGGNASTASGLAPGTYTVFVKDSGSCTGTATVSISQPATALTAAISSTNILCFGSATGVASVTANGGTPGYTYTWSPVSGNAATANNLSAGIYTVQIKDANGCNTTLTTTISQPASGLTSVISSTNILCFGGNTGAANVIANGGTPGYSYTWSPTGGNVATANGLPVGTYTVTVKDTHNCTSTSTVTISQPASSLNAIMSSTNILCFGAGNGAANIIVNGGTPGYSYTWSPAGGNAATANNLSAGNYTVQIKDANNCTLTKTATISQPLSSLNAVMFSTNVLCFGAGNGAANVIVNGGTPGYSYTWSPSGGNTNSANPLLPGMYTVTIKDINNCVTQATTNISQPSSALSTTALTNSVTCFGMTNGSSTVNAMGGTPVYSYTWLPIGGHSNVAAGLSSGSYTVFIKDINNCSTALSFFLSQPNPLTLNVNSIMLCNNQPGVLTSTASGGVLPYSYNWNGLPGGSNTLAVTGTATTIYTVNVTDANGCASTIQTATVNIPGSLNLLVTPGFSVCSGENAVLSASVTGVTGNYSYTWQPGSLSGPTQNIFPITSSQVYTVSVNDGCSSVISKTVSLISYPIPSSNIVSSEPKGCAPLCVTFSDPNLFSSGLVQSFQWDFANGQSTLPAPQNCYSKAGDYSVILNYVTINGCVGSQTLTNYVHIDPMPTADFITDKQEIDIYNATINFTNQSTNANEFTWFFSGQGTSNETNPSFSFVKEEDQLILLVAKNEFGCIDTMMKEIKYKSDFTFFAPNAFSQNNDNLNDIFLPKGIGWDVNRFELTIYDRWGAKLFGTKRYDEGWDGKVAGGEHKVQSGVYVWKVSLYDVYLKHHEFIGHVLVEDNSKN